jgi:hypothetical protein
MPCGASRSVKEKTGFLPLKSFGKKQLNSLQTFRFTKSHKGSKQRRFCYSLCVLCVFVGKISPTKNHSKKSFAIPFVCFVSLWEKIYPTKSPATKVLLFPLCALCLCGKKYIPQRHKEHKDYTLCFPVFRVLCEKNISHKDTKEHKDYTLCFLFYNSL